MVGRREVAVDGPCEFGEECGSVDGGRRRDSRLFEEVKRALVS